MLACAQRASLHKTSFAQLIVRSTQHDVSVLSLSKLDRVTGAVYALPWLAAELPTFELTIYQAVSTAAEPATWGDPAGFSPPHA